ncbi:MAG: cytochrome c biogenesis protein CcsA [Proteobacteria bacterium]|nr:cytochrome c biogenesis protein CcsA [Pseudomonadota bacterium]
MSLFVGGAVLAVSGWLVWLSRGREHRGHSVAGLLALAALLLWAWMVAFHAPVERAQGLVQKIFYVHVPCVIPAYLGFGLTALAGIGFLRSRNESWDRLAAASAEVGVVFCSLILATGPIWAKPVWGHWWVWDLRLTSTLVLWFIYLAYLLLRGFAFGSDTARTFTAVYGIVGTAAIPFVYFAVDLARGDTLHPSNPAREGLPAAMSETLGAGMVAFVLVFGFLTARRLAAARLESDLLEASERSPVG